MEIKNYDFAGKKAIVRVDFNVPLKEGKITDDTRIRGAVPTLKLILEKGGALIIMSHMGKPKGKVKPELSLGQIKDAVAQALGVKEVQFAGGCHVNLQGIGRLVSGMKVEDVINRLEGVNCNGKGTSCPDQLAKALRSIPTE